MKKYFLSLSLCIALIFPLSVFSQTSIKNALNDLISDSSMQHAKIGFELRNSANDSTIFSYNAQTSLTPASTMKIVTTAAALEMLGPDFKFKTVIRYDGKIDASGTLHGNIYIKGGGDPCLGSRFFPTYYTNFLQKWADAIKKAGIKKVTGSVIADCSLYGIQSIPNEWIWGDIGNYYGSGAFALTVYDNAFSAFYNTGYAVGSPTKITKIEPYIPYLKIENYVVSARVKSDKSFFYGGPHEYKRVSRGKLPRNRAAYQVKGDIPDPGLLLAYQLDSVLKNNHITILKKYQITYTPPKDTDFTKLYETDSPKLSLIISMTNHFSVNLFAEQIFRYLGWYKNKDASYEKCIETVKDFWKSKGINTDALFMYDGCGLSPHDAVSPQFYCNLLDYMYNKSKVKDAFYHSLPVSCHIGTLEGFCAGTAACGNVRAKSGSINEVKCYAGFIRNKVGKYYTFAIMLNNFNCSIREAEKKLSPLMNAIVDYTGDSTSTKP